MHTKNNKYSFSCVKVNQEKFVVSFFFTLKINNINFSSPWGENSKNTIVVIPSLKDFKIFDMYISDYKTFKFLKVSQGTVAKCSPKSRTTIQSFFFIILFYKVNPHWALINTFLSLPGEGEAALRSMNQWHLTPTIVKYQHRYLLLFQRLLI